MTKLFGSSRLKVLSLDPGESTGWVAGEILLGRDKDEPPQTTCIRGGTAGKDHLEVADLLWVHYPDVIVLERFNLYPSMAKNLAWNSFYPCEVIGVVKYLCMKEHIQLVEQAPSIKKFAGGLQHDWTLLKRDSTGVTEHTQDAYLHYRYFMRNGLASLRKEK